MPGACPRRKIADFLGPDLHPARPNDDVFPSAWPSWLSFTPATTRLNGDRGARPPTFKGDSRKTSKKTQAPHTGGAVSHAERFRSRPGRGGRLLLCMRTTFSVGNRPGARCRRFAHLRRRHGNLLLLGDWNPRGLERVEQFAGPSEIARGRCQSFHERLPTAPCLRQLEGKWLNLLDRSEVSRVGVHHRRPGHGASVFLESPWNVGGRAP